jgi:sec-independent protein translocase protein TatA
MAASLVEVLLMPLGIFNVGTMELMIILLVALLMFGGRLPEVARSLGKSVNQFKRGLKDVEQEMSDADAAPPKSLSQQPQSQIQPPLPSDKATVPPDSNAPR